MKEENNLPLSISLLALTGIICSGCKQNEEEKTVYSVFQNAHNFIDYDSTTLNIPPVYYCISEAEDQITPIELAIETELPNIPDELPVYKVIRPEVNNEYAVNIANKLDLNDNLEVLEGYDYPRNGFKFRKSGKTLYIYENGSVAAYYSVSPNRPSNLPSNEECIKIAKDWLNDNALYPENVISISISPIIIYLGTGIEIVDQYTQNMSVVFSTGTNGYEAHGMGAYISIGENGEIIEVYINAPKFEQYTTVKLQQPKTIVNTFAAYLDNLELFYSDAPLCLVNAISYNMIVMNIKLKYFCMLNEGNSIKALAQPVLVLEGKENISDPLNSGAFIARVDAVDRE